MLPAAVTAPSGPVIVPPSQRWKKEKTEDLGARNKEMEIKDPELGFG
jgi:hypothetical protein